MDPIKEAFQKVREDIDSLREELRQTKQEMVKIIEILEKIAPKTPSMLVQRHPAQDSLKQTIPTHIPAHPAHFYTGNQGVSTGNRGVPTDRQTNQQTDNIWQNPLKTQEKAPIDDAVKLLDSLDSLKKEIRIKFKQLTDQEMLVFSTLYQLEEEQGQVDYKALAQKLSLTESSIRDYIGKLLKKGIPIEKIRLNNKQIQLSVSLNLKKIASLQTILQLRGI